jgi:hypothetical protein
MWELRVSIWRRIKTLLDSGEKRRIGYDERCASVSEILATKLHRSDERADWRTFYLVSSLRIACSSRIRWGLDLG